MIQKRIGYVLLVVVFGILGISMVSCEDHFEDQALHEQDELSVSVSAQTIVLEELFFTNEIDVNWTTGTNQGTGGAIRYTLELEGPEGDFSNPMAVLEAGVQQTYSHKITYGDLNQLLLDHGFMPGISYTLKVRVTAMVSANQVTDQQAETTFEVTPFRPVSQTLFVVGDATPNGWDISNAAELTPQNGQRGVLVYQGDLQPGNFKFAVTQDGCWCQDFYTRNASDADLMVYNEGGSGEDLQWTITEAAPEGEEYRLEADLLNLTLSITTVPQTLDEPPFPALWIVGDASASGWNIDSPSGFVQSSVDPFVFSYEGHLSPGNFKIFAGPLGDWCGQWYRPESDNMDLTDGSVNQNSGCDTDNKWLVTASNEGRYKITLNTADNTIAFQQVMLYIIGDGGPNGWNIADPSPMTYQNGEYVFSGALGADNATGEFKFSKFIGDWCNGDWINAATASQSINNTNFITTHGCDGPDNKWQLQTGQAGNYEIRFNLDTNTMTVTPI